MSAYELATSTLWLWACWEIHFFSLQHRAWFCQTDCRRRPYLLLQTGRGKQLIKISHFLFLSVVFFFFWAWINYARICSEDLFIHSENIYVNRGICFNVTVVFDINTEISFWKFVDQRKFFPGLLNCNYHFFDGY